MTAEVKHLKTPWKKKKMVISGKGKVRKKVVVISIKINCERITFGKGTNKYPMGEFISCIIKIKRRRIKRRPSKIK